MLAVDSEAIKGRIHALTIRLVQRPFNNSTLKDFEAEFVNPMKPISAYGRNWPHNAALSQIGYREYVEDARDWHLGDRRPGWEERYEKLFPARRADWIKRRAEHLRFLAENIHLVLEPNFSMRVVAPLEWALINKCDIGMEFAEYREYLIRIRRHLLEHAVGLTPQHFEKKAS